MAESIHLAVVQLSVTAFQRFLTTMTSLKLAVDVISDVIVSHYYHRYSHHFLISSLSPSWIPFASTYCSQIIANAITVLIVEILLSTPRNLIHRTLSKGIIIIIFVRPHYNQHLNHRNHSHQYSQIITTIYTFISNIIVISMMMSSPS